MQRNTDLGCMHNQSNREQRRGYAQEQEHVMARRQLWEPLQYGRECDQARLGLDD